MKKLALLFVFCLFLSAQSFAQEVSHGEVVRINFDKGKNSKEIIGSLPSDEEHRYILSANEGQILAVKVYPLTMSIDSNNLAFDILYVPYQSTSEEEVEKFSLTEGVHQVWGGVVPFSGDYEILITLTEGNAMYALEVMIIF